jgi:hypothetical protein
MRHLRSKKAQWRGVGEIDVFVIAAVNYAEMIAVQMN